MLYSDKELRWFDKQGQKRPTHQPHGRDGELRPLDMNPRNWRLEGNNLMCDTDQGPFVQTIATDLILTGVDDKGQPILKKVELS